MKKIILFLLAVAVCGQLSAQRAKANRETEQFKYDIECAGNGVQGTYLVKVWSYSSSKKIAKEQSRKNAVHGVIFKGFAGTDGCVSQRPMAGNSGVEIQHKEYFDSFFANGGEALKYASIVNGTDEIVKVGAGRYKVGVVVTVYKENLREAGVDMETEFGDDELGDIIENWLSGNTVMGRFSKLSSSENFAIYEQVRIPLFDEKGRALDTNGFAKMLRNVLRKEPYNIPCKIIDQGLGTAILVLGEK